MGGQEWAQQITTGIPTVGNLAEPGAFQDKTTAGPVLAPQQLLDNAKWSVGARRTAAPYSRGGTPWEGALNRIDQDWLEGPFPSDGEGKLVTGFGAPPVNPASRFGSQRGRGD